MAHWHEFTVSVKADDRTEAYRRLGFCLADYNGKDDERHSGSMAIQRELR